MLQKYFPILEEVNSPLAAMAALELTANAAKIVINGISNEVLESLLKNAVSSTETHCKEIEASAEELAAVRVAASKHAKTLRYRAACAARAARAVSKLSRQVKASKRPVASKASLRGLSGLSIEVCRQRAASAQSAVHSVATIYNTTVQAVELAIQGGDIRVIRSSVAALKASVRELEIAHLNFRFAREMVSISLARHSA